MRRFPALMSVAVSSALVLSLTLTNPAHAQTISKDQFGMHIPGISTGTVPTIPVGSVRLWDSGISWGLVQQTEKRFWWTGLDRAVSTAQSQGYSIVYVLGATPTWAASNTKQGTYPYRGAASMPKNMKVWRKWVKAVAKRYKGKIQYYQIWNEANISTFWQGTPEQMADLTAEAAKIIRKVDKRAKIVSASSTVRLDSAYKRFLPPYLKALKKKKWPVDVFAAHFYPASRDTPATRAQEIIEFTADLRKAKAPRRPIWDTEVNYGLAGPGPSNPRRTITGDQAAAWVSQSYLDNVRLGVSSAYWYFWGPANNLLGITMQPETPGAIGWQTTYDWLVGSNTTCTSGAVNVCTVSKDGQTGSIAWASTGSGTFVVPAGANTQVTAMNVSSPAVAGETVTIGSMPTWFGFVAPTS